MSQRNNVAVIEGNLNAADYDDSSDDDEDDPKEVVDSVVVDSVQRDDEFSSSYDKDEEELEIFSKIDVALKTDLHHQQASVEDAKKDVYKKKPEMSLIEAMSASVTQIEQANFMVTDTHLPMQSKSVEMNVRESTSINSPVPVNAAVVAAVDPAEGPDVFGIAYKPFMKKKEEYNMPKGAAFEDEVEFEKELDELNRVKNSKIFDDDDDEFDLDIGIEDDSEIIKNLIENASVEAKRAARIAKEIEEEEAFLEALKKENRLALESEKLNMKEIPIILEIEEKHDTKTLSKQALDDIVGVYSSGLGDQDVRMLDVNEKLNVNLKGVGTIEEGDEDQEEREEEQAVVANAERKHMLSQIEAEWADIDEHPIDNHQNKRDNSNSTKGTEYKRVLYTEALAYLSNLDLTPYESMITIKEEKSNSWSLLNRITELSFENSIEKLKFPFLIAQVDYEDSDFTLFSIMQTVYQELVLNNSKHVLCPNVGPHWERIGFQGNDPRTDVNRSMKMLALLQVLNMVETKKSVTDRLYIMSNMTPSSTTDNHDLSWPFMCVSIMFTKESVQAMRSGILNKECNRQGDVLTVMNAFHQACFFEFARLIVSNPLLHHAVHLASVRDSCKKNPLNILKNYKLNETNNFASISLDILYKTIKTPMQIDKSSKSVTKNMKAPKSSDSNNFVSEQNDNFDNLETMDDDGDDNIGTHNDNKNDKKSFSRSIWSSLTGGDKSSKFKI